MLQTRTKQEAAAIDRHKDADRIPAILISAAENHVDGLLVVDDRRTIIAASEGAGRLLGLSENGDSALLGRDLASLFPDEASLIDQLAPGKSQRFNYRSPAQADQSPLATVTLSSLILEERRYGIVSLNAFLQEADWGEKLIHSNRLAGIGTLTTSIAHELTNPISVILTTCLNLSEVLSGSGEENNQELIQQYIGMIHNNAGRLANLVDTLRSYTHHQPLRTPTPLNQLIRYASELVSPRLEKRDNLILCFDLAESLPLVNCDPNQIMQVIINLLINARDALKRPGGIIEISSQAVPDQDAIAFAVRDNGPGIPTDQLPDIFEPFFTTKRRGEGTGLGLFISAQIVRQHQGWIRAENRSGPTNHLPTGSGACFTVTLPTG